MFRAVARNPHGPHPPGDGASFPRGDEAPSSEGQFRAADRNEPSQGAGPSEARPSDEGKEPTLGERMDIDAEGPQGPGDASNPPPVDEPMHDAHAETGVGLRPDPHPVQEQGVVSGAGPAAEVGDKVHSAEASASSKHDRDEVIP
jgi:hypothetical protein